MNCSPNELPINLERLFNELHDEVTIDQIYNAARGYAAVEIALNSISQSHELDTSLNSEIIADILKKSTFSTIIGDVYFDGRGNMRPFDVTVLLPVASDGQPLNPPDQISPLGNIGTGGCSKKSCTVTEEKTCTKDKDGKETCTTVKRTTCEYACK